MRPFHLHQYKTTIWWSAKSGCSSIKYIAHRILLKDDHPIHKDTWDLNPECLSYTNIVIVRDPKTRIVASYLDKYNWWKEGLFENKDFSFAQFLQRLELDQRSKIAPEHHYAAQFEEAFSDVERLYMLRFHRRFHFDFIYKLEEINWSQFLATHFHVSLEGDLFPPGVLHATKKNKDYMLSNASEIPKPHLMNEENECPNYMCFFTPKLLEMIQHLYKKDYDYLSFYHIHY